MALSGRAMACFEAMGGGVRCEGGGGGGGSYQGLLSSSSSATERGYLSNLPPMHWSWASQHQDWLRGPGRWVATARQASRCSKQHSSPLQHASHARGHLTPSLNRVPSSPDPPSITGRRFCFLTASNFTPHPPPTTCPGPVALHLTSGRCDPLHTTTLGARHFTYTMSKGVQQDSLIFDDEEEETCPLCVEEFDLTDKGFKPCPCGYQVCFPVERLM